MHRVFLSSTFEDLVPERKAVENAIHRMSSTYIGMEHFGSFPAAPLQECLARVRSADVLILVLDAKYGFIPEGEDRSITELEYAEAAKNRIPTLPYIRKTSDLEAMLAGPHKSTHSADESALAAFKAKLENSHGVSWFKGPDDLAWMVAADLAREFSQVIGAKPTIEESRNALLAQPIALRLEELVSILEERAARIQSELQPFYRYAKIKKYLAEFERLHLKHIAALRAARIIQAHELLGQIHKISVQLESDEFWTRHRAETPHICYQLRRDAFQRGRLICGYIAGDLTTYSEKYSSEDGFGASWRGESETTPLTSVALYQKILASDA